MPRVRTNGDGVPVVAVDIDGTLGDYHRHFLRFAEEWLGKLMPAPDAFNPGMRLHQYMGIPLRQYREVKLAYRQGGLKRWMPCYAGAAELTTAINAAGAEVWICTTRPYLRLDNIDPDTQEWLRRNRIRYQAVIYGEDKYQELKRQAGSRVAAVLEDLPELIRVATRLFPKAIVIGRDQPYNYLGTERSGAWADSLPEAEAIILDAIKIWKEYNVEVGSGTARGPRQRQGR